MASLPTLASITIDMDSLHLYQRIFGLPEDGQQQNIIYERALERFCGLLDQVGLRATFFVVSDDLDLGDNEQTVAALAQSGHEIASHSRTHDYRLSRFTADEQAGELKHSKDRLEACTGQPVQGFRAPGYNVNETLLREVNDAGYRYDSSVFPCLPYYATKAAALGAFQVMGKASQSILCGPRVLAAPLGPYRMNPNRYWRRGEGLWELPISVAPLSRLPLLGSFLILTGKRLWPVQWKMTRRSSPLLNLEFHGMDFLDLHDGLPKELVSKQVDLQTPWSEKRALLLRILEEIADDCVTLPLSAALNRLEGVDDPTR